MLVACNATTTSASLPNSDAAKGDSARPAVGETEDAAATGSDGAAPDEASPADATITPEDAGDPAPMQCDMDASLEASVTECPPPFSECADSQQLMYFAWGQCVAGWCSWPQMTTRCPYGCWRGGCLAPPTM